jgi:Fe-S-cluster containining protein
MDHLERRKILLNHMVQLSQQGWSCQGCAGTCCTSIANSMMVTPQEAIDVMTWLDSAGKLDSQLHQKLQETVHLYRLDRPLGNGKKSFLRRTYTCPFFMQTELGCSLPAEYKPYGCLGFNAHHTEIKAKEYCFSDQHILEQTEGADSHSQDTNLQLIQKYSLNWEKAPLPLALLDLWFYFNADGLKSN